MSKLSSVRLSGLLLLASLVLAGCGGSTGVVKQVSPEDRFKHAKELFDDKDYLEAINEFNVITVQDQGSAFAADAQYYLAESRYMRGEYLLAAFEYNVLKRSYPASPRVPEAQYKMALSYYELSPRAPLDQQYTRKAIDEFQSFIEYYPNNPLVKDAAAKINELNTRLAKKQYETAKLYTTMEYYRAALLSYDEVIEKYHDTEYAPLAYQAKIELLMSRNHYKQAAAEIDRFLSRFPNSVLKGTMDGLKQRADREIAAGHNVDSNAPPRAPQATEVSPP